MTSFIKLSNTPIKEIILTISFEETLSIEDLDKYKGLPEVAKFTSINSGFAVKMDMEQDVTTVPKPALDGYLLKCVSESRIIHIRRGSFAYHKVDGYESFDSLIVELQTYWTLLLNLVTKLTVNNLSVRYLNFIEYVAGENPDDLINIRVHHPFGQNIDSSILQVSFEYENRSDLLATIVTGRAAKAEVLGTVLDIVINQRILNETNTKVVFDQIKLLQRVKNDLFFKSITEKAIQKFS